MMLSFCHLLQGDLMVKLYHFQHPMFYFAYVLLFYHNLTVSKIIINQTINLLAMNTKFSYNFVTDYTVHGGSSPSIFY